MKRVNRGRLPVLVAVAIAMAGCSSPSGTPDGAMAGCSASAAISDERVDLAIFWNGADQSPRFQIGTRMAADRDELERVLLDMQRDFERLRKPAVPVRIDASAEVPWEDVVAAVGVCRTAGLRDVCLMVP